MSEKRTSDEWEPLPRNLDAIKAWYRASQIEEHPYLAPRELSAQVLHQISVSLTEGRPLARIHLKRLIEYAARFEEGDAPPHAEHRGLDSLPVPKDR